MRRLSSSPPCTPVQRMVRPRPYNTDPLTPLPPLPWPRTQREEVPPSTVRTSRSDPLPLRATPASVEHRPFNSSPIPLPPLYKMPNEDDDWDDDDASTLPEIPWYEDWDSDDVSTLPEIPLRMVRFRDTPSVHEVERIGWKPVPRKASSSSLVSVSPTYTMQPAVVAPPAFRIHRVKRRSPVLRALKKMSEGCFNWVMLTVCVVVVLVALTPSRPKGIPPDFYFTHTTFSKLSPVEVAPFGYMMRAGNAGLKELNKVIEWHKGALDRDWVRPQRKRAWQDLLRQVDVVKLEWLKVLAKVNSTEAELGMHIVAWNKAVAEFRASMEPAVHAYLFNHTRVLDDEQIQDLWQRANTSAKAIDNYARSATLSLEATRVMSELQLPLGERPWQDVLLCSAFEEDKPWLLSKVPDLFIPVVPSWTSRWLDMKRKRRNFSSDMAQRVSYFEAYYQIVNVSIEHLKNSSRVVERMVAGSKDEAGELASVEEISKAMNDIAGGISRAIDEGF
ncbi:uncharacterized protein BKA78DRAFT_300776 [Phyllosticta capitalensis]|uniref:Uncharacterized protein n=1 Tax=Phyllosticta capitalensis TaxID=121624 RepID=A0ABR1Y8Z4_9PEZI